MLSGCQAASVTYTRCACTGAGSPIAARPVPAAGVERPHRAPRAAAGGVKAGKAGRLVAPRLFLVRLPGSHRVPALGDNDVSPPRLRSTPRHARVPDHRLRPPDSG